MFVVSIFNYRFVIIIVRCFETLICRFSFCIQYNVTGRVKCQFFTRFVDVTSVCKKFIIQCSNPGLVVCICIIVIIVKLVFVSNFVCVCKNRNILVKFTTSCHRKPIAFLKPRIFRKYFVSSLIAVQIRRC